MAQDKKKAGLRKDEEAFSILNYLKACARKPRWFVVSVLVFIALGALWCIRQQPLFVRTMAILVKDQRGGGGMADMANAFSSLGLVSTNTNVKNELIALKSPAVMTEVVAQLDLEMNYLLRGFPHGITLYGSTLPITVKFLDVEAKDPAQFRFDMNPDGSGVLSHFRKVEGTKLVKVPGEVKVPAGVSVVKTPVGKVEITANPRYAGTGFVEPVSIVVSKSGFMNAVESYAAKLKGDLADNEAEVINLSIKDVSVERATDVLNTVLNVYTEQWVKDKNRMAVATSKFINERLQLIEQQLGGVDSDIMNYRSKHLMTNVEESARIGIASTQKNKEEALEVATQLEMARFVADYVSTPSNANGIIPINTGVGNPQLESQIGQYNNILLARNNMAESSSASNPLVKDYDAQLKGMREAISRSLDNQVVNLQNSLRNLNREQGDLRGELAAAPLQAKQLLSVERQQKVMESLYLYLLQKREENELSQTFTADNTRVITPPMGPQKPVAPMTSLILSVMFILGLAVPGVAVYALEVSNTKVRSRKDLENMATPLVGEIPFLGKKKKFAWVSKMLPKKKKAKQLETLPVRVQRGSRDLVNESFRIIRGSLDFMMRHDKSRTIMVTSFNPGSGKSFVTFNLAASFAFKDKKVLIIDCDLRHGSASQFVGMPPRGLSSYLSGSVQDWKPLVKSVEENLDMLPIGHRPPNPAELLESPRMAELVAEAHKTYDYVILDCPPVDVVVDTQLLSPVADRTVFVVRAGILEKADVDEIDKIYKENRFKQVSVLLNGTDKHFSRFGNDGRGYYGTDYAVE